MARLRRGKTLLLFLMKNVWEWRTDRRGNKKKEKVFDFARKITRSKKNPFAWVYTDEARSVVYFDGIVAEMGTGRDFKLKELRGG